MAAASNKPGFAVFASVFLFLSTVIFGILYYVTAQNESKAQTDLKAAIAKEKEAEDFSRRRTTELEAAKQVMIEESPEAFGDPNNPGADQTSVIAKVRADLAKFDPTPGDPPRSYRALLLEMQSALTTTNSNLTATTAQLKSTEDKLLALEQKWTAANNVEKTARSGAESDLQTVQTSKEEEIAAKQRDIEEQAKALSDLDLRRQELEQQVTQLSDKKNEVERNLNAQIAKLRDELDVIKRGNFDVADGFIRYVDMPNKIVWISVGEADGLRLQTSFTVYTATNSGFGRSAEDIKGKIEVTRLVGPHMAEARIVEADIYKPFAVRDPIYTPLWDPGTTESFAFAGLVDLNGDGVSDREEMRQLLAVSGATIDVEISDDGERIGKGINENTKFLVLGSLPREAAAADQEQQAKNAKVMAEFTKLREEAREYGVQIVNLSNFMNYYNVRKRLYQPGDRDDRTLKSGSHSNTVNETLGNRTSSGNTSGTYNPAKNNLRPPVSGAARRNLYNK